MKLIKTILIIATLGFSSISNANQDFIADVKCLNRDGSIALESLFLIKEYEMREGLIIRGYEVTFHKSGIHLSKESDAGQVITKDCSERTIEFVSTSPEKLLVCGAGSEVILEPSVRVRFVPTGLWYYEMINVSPKIGKYDSCNLFNELQ